MSELDKIDLIRTRLGVSYKEAKAALDAAGGDVVQALIFLEEKEGHHPGEGIYEKGSEFFEQIKEALQKKQGYRIKVKQGERTVTEFPATLGALGLLGALASSQIAVLGVLASVAGMANKYSLEFERADGSAGSSEKSDAGASDL